MSTNATILRNLILRSTTNGWFTDEEVGEALQNSPRAAFLGLGEILARQTVDERASKGTRYKNKFGFSKMHVTPGTTLAKKYASGERLTQEDMESACEIAFAYRKQLWMILVGAVPVNNLNLR
jgi:hypothetical protein